MAGGSAEGGSSGPTTSTVTRLPLMKATFVDYAPVFPAFAYRFDTPEGSLVFSGDTSPSENLVPARCTDAGLALGGAVHGAYCLVGGEAAISRTILLFNVATRACAAA